MVLTRRLHHLETRPGPPNATWLDIKQLGWAVLLLVPIVAVVCSGAVGLVGSRAAFWIGFGLVAFTVGTFALIVCVNLLASYAYDLVSWILTRRRSR